MAELQESAIASWPAEREVGSPIPRTKPILTDSGNKALPFPLVQTARPSRGSNDNVEMAVPSLTLLTTRWICFSAVP